MPYSVDLRQIIFFNFEIVYFADSSFAP